MSGLGILLCLLAVIVFLIGAETLDYYFSRAASPLWKLFLGVGLLAAGLLCFAVSITV